MAKRVSMQRQCQVVGLLLAAVWTIGCQDARRPEAAAPAARDSQTTTPVASSIAATNTATTPTPSAAPAGKATVLWISVDGFRGDYIDRSEAPFLKSLMEHGLYTRQLTPIFPSLTFPSHTAEATGVTAGTHGIVSNKWFDLAAGQEFNMPSDPKLLEAEPIWITAARQGVRTAVLDWPLSQAEDGLPENARASVFNARYVPELTDEQRLENVVAAYRKDFEEHQDGEPGPLRLLMGYVHDVDSAGHKYGPDAPETNKAIQSEDAVVKKIVGEVTELFKQHMHPENGDALYVLITTDHGMDNVKTLVNLQKLLGDIGQGGTVRLETSGSLANIYLNGIPGPERDDVAKKILETLAAQPFVKAWKRDELPANFGYANATRTGDIVASLAPGYDFTTHGEEAVAPAETDPRALKGMHGYDPAEDEKMLGFAVLVRSGSDRPGRDLGKLDTLRIHPTVAKLLGIQPASGAKAEPIEPLP